MASEGTRLWPQSQESLALCLRWNLCVLVALSIARRADGSRATCAWFSSERIPGTEPLNLRAAHPGCCSKDSHFTDRGTEVSGWSGAEPGLEPALLTATLRTRDANRRHFAFLQTLSAPRRTRVRTAPRCPALLPLPLPLPEVLQRLFTFSCKQIDWPLRTDSALLNFAKALAPKEVLERFTLSRQPVALCASRIVPGQSRARLSFWWCFGVSAPGLCTGQPRAGEVERTVPYWLCGSPQVLKKFGQVGVPLQVLKAAWPDLCPGRHQAGLRRKGPPLGSGPSPVCAACVAR